VNRTSLCSFFIGLASIKVISWLFASCVFGAYTISFEAALVESFGYYGPIFSSAYLSNMVLPIEISIVAWIIISILLFVGQFAARPIHWDTVFISSINLAASLFVYGTLAVSLFSVHYGWFVASLDLPPSVKIIAGAMTAAALAYVVASPLFWRKGWKFGIVDHIRPEDIHYIEGPS
jgi:hypothetical protein